VIWLVQLMGIISVTGLAIAGTPQGGYALKFDYRGLAAVSVGVIPGATLAGERLA
jgi:hypothetical protein